MFDSTTYFKNLANPEEYKRIIKLNTINEMLNKIENEYADLPAFGISGQVITYGETMQDVAKGRGFLSEQKLKKKAHIGLLLKNDYNFVKVFLSAVSNGDVAVLIPYQVSSEDLNGILHLCEVDLLVYDEESEEKVQQVKAINNKVKFFASQTFTSTKTAPMADDINSDSDAVIIFTGGTSAKAKAVLLGHGAIMRGVYNGCLGFKNVFNKRYFSLIPLTHVFGLIRNLLTSMYTGSTFYLCPNMREMFKELPVARPTILVVVPELAKLFYGIMKSKGINAIGGCLDTVICGGAPVPTYLPGAYATLGIDLFPGYGLTETANLVSGNASFMECPESVGMPYAGQEFKIVDGELWIKGDNIMKCYYNNPVETANAFEDGYFKTGDLARFDENGLLYIVGRKKNLIVLDNGENISPEELEAKLNQVPFIQDSLVYQDTNEFGNGIIIAEVLPNKAVLEAMKVENPEATIKDAINKLNASLPTYSRIASIIVRTTEFTRSPSMKIIRPKKN